MNGAYWPGTQQVPNGTRVDFPARKSRSQNFTAKTRKTQKQLVCSVFCLFTCSQRTFLVVSICGCTTNQMFFQQNEVSPLPPPVLPSRFKQAQIFLWDAKAIDVEWQMTRKSELLLSLVLGMDTRVFVVQCSVFPLESTHPPPEPGHAALLALLVP